MALHLIKGTPKPRKRASDPRPAEMLQCYRCGCRELIEARVGVMVRDGKTSGGTKQMLCAACLLKGERVVVA